MSNQQQMKIKIASVDVGTAKSAKGKDYTFVEVMYKNMTFDGKAETKKHNQFGNKDVFETLKSAQAGAEYTITREKDDNGYWQWVGINEGFGAAQSAPAKSSSGSSAQSAPSAAPRSNFESPEERAKKQVYIVRQSSISAAIDMLKTDKKSPSVDEVLDVAKIFEQFVFGVNLDADKPTDKLPEFDEDGDIPM